MRVDMRDELVREVREWSVNQDALRSEKKSKLEWKSKVVSLESRLNSMHGGRNVKKQAEPAIDVSFQLC